MFEVAFKEAAVLFGEALQVGADEGSGGGEVFGLVVGAVVEVEVEQAAEPVCGAGVARQRGGGGGGEVFGQLCAVFGEDFAGLAGVVVAFGDEFALGKQGGEFVQALPLLPLLRGGLFEDGEEEGVVVAQVGYRVLLEIFEPFAAHGFAGGGVLLELGEVAAEHGG